jgi:hypothetical protein
MTDKWQLYSQTGIDGPEYGVRIRPGYVVVGFQLEDARQIVAWQNASIQPEGDILERAKASAENIDHYAYDCDFEEARRVILALIAEVERLQDLIDSPPEEADWLHDDTRLCGEITTGVVQIARKWHSAYRKAQNSNLMRAKEVERLRAEREVWIKHYQENSQQAARIQELEGSVCRSNPPPGRRRMSG